MWVYPANTHTNSKNTLFSGGTCQKSSKSPSGFIFALKNKLTKQKKILNKKYLPEFI